MKKRMTSLLLAAAVLLCACSFSRAESGKAAIDLDDYFTKRDLAGTWDEKDAETILLSESITIEKAGTYILSGEIRDGTVTVNVGGKDKVQLVLDGVNITSSSSAALLVENADKVFVTFKEGTQNTLTSTCFDGSSDVDGAVYARDDIVFNGAGALTVVSAKHGIVANDDVKFAGGTYAITAGSRGIIANDSVRIAGGVFTIVSEKDAIRAKADDTEKGYVLIAGGEMQLTVGGGHENGAAHTDSMFRDRRGWTGASAAEEDSVSAKGIRASGDIIVTGGAIIINSADDALHGNAGVTINAGVLTVQTGDDAIHADADLTINGGSIDIQTSYEGLEAANVTINGGSIALKASDDGLNSAGGNDSSGWGWKDMFASDGSKIEINGGSLYVNAAGDGIDSNGDFIVNGGSVVVSGPTNSGNGALDYNGTGAVHGGTVIAAGAVGMAVTFGSASTQVSFMVNLSGAAGSEIRVTDQNGQVILSGTVEKSFQCVVISSPDLQEGQTYTVSAGSASTSYTVTGVSSGGSGMGGFGGGGRPGGDFGGSGGGPGRK